MAQITVSTQAQFLAAINKAKSGDTILLEDGHYGQVTLKHKFAAEVTIAAVNPQGAVFDKIEVRGGSNMHFDGLQLTGEFRAWYSSTNIGISESKASSYYFRDVDGLDIDRSEGAGGYNILTLNHVTDFRVTNSHFHDSIVDVSRITGDSHDGLFENNVFSDVRASHPDHPDLMQFLNVGALTPHDIVIRGNLFYDDPKTGSVNAQGIFMGGPGTYGFKNILIEENLVAVRSPNSIYINGGQENVIVRNNTLMGYDDSNGGVIRLAKVSGLDNSGTIVEGNIARALVDETRASSLGENLLYNKTATASIFAGAGGGSKWEDFLHASTDHMAYGASGRLADLMAARQQQSLQAMEKDMLAGAGQAPEPQPEPEPEPEPELVFGLDGTRTFSGRIDGRVKKIADDDKFDLGEGTIAFDFKADTIGKGGLVSKDAAGQGSHFAVWIDNGTLKIMAGDATSAETISVAGIKAKATYEFVASFDEDSTTVWLDGKQVGEIDGHMDWHENDEVLMLGAENSRSASGSTAGARYAYDGKITDFAIYDHAMTADELQAHLASQTLV